ncbi:hypothetical protein [Mucilaginibacter polytrichastri]|uniref:DUF4105 domain-containing protein n=1 Tax=Mucilaginibacter polytrichastri TaxID=1302689 RepID=A0A1Q5ZWF0_9SPHI|nr:hypothetical protein [Mucilaginibacter polytrichastri]OKS86089.1 hypothetical protein RG47T_1538 [Mucilaginibacter polytrichastri]
MGIANKYIVLQFAAILLVPVVIKAQAVNAHAVYVIAHHVIKPDQQLTHPLIVNKPDSVGEPAGISATSIANHIDELLEETNGLAETRVNRQFSRVLKHIRIKDLANQGATDKRVYMRMADLFVRLKLYPLAMKCYLKTLPVVSQNVVSVNHSQPDTLADKTTTDSLLADNRALNLNLKDDTVFSDKAQWLENHANERRSEGIGSQKIAEAFNDGKTAFAYALLFHVKQPVPGRRKVFHWSNTGHTFITLIKYNDDSTSVTRSFGFYPKKDNILSATPLAPTTSAVFKDDGGHNWDEVVGKFISRHKFKRVLKLVSRFSETDYQLSTNNCTDFAISAATIAGIYISNTKAKWPLGSGNNPGATGQSILTNKVSADDHAPLFVYKNLSAVTSTQ